MNTIESIELHRLTAEFYRLVALSDLLGMLLVRRKQSIDQLLDEEVISGDEYLLQLSKGIQDGRDLIAALDARSLPRAFEEAMVLEEKTQ
jgi:hypothetical protein